MTNRNPERAPEFRNSDSPAGLLNNNGLPSGFKRTTQTAIEIRLWEVYLIRSRTSLKNILSGYALDKGPMPAIAEDFDRVSFRFMKYDWEKSVKQLLIASNVPFEVVTHFQTDALQQISKKRVYVAEDDLNILFALNTMLEDAGYDVILSHCGNPIMEKNLPPTDLFILDKRMPDIDGIEVCRHLRAQAATRDTPIVMISAARNFSHQAYKAGVNDCLEKPFQMKELLRLVSKHTAQKVKSDH